MHTLGTWLGALSMAVGTTDAPNGTNELIESTRAELAAATQRANAYDDVPLRSTSVSAALDVIHSLRAAYPLAHGATPTATAVTAQTVSRVRSMPMNAAVRAAADDECDCLASSAPSMRSSLYLDIGPTLWLPGGDGSTVDFRVTFVEEEAMVTLAHGQSRSEVIDTLNASFGDMLIEARTADDAPRRVRILDPRCAWDFFHGSELEIEQITALDHPLVTSRPIDELPQFRARTWDSPPLAGDVDCDRTFGFDEIVSVLSRWGEASAGYDGVPPIDAGDVEWLLDNWGPVALPVIHVDASAPAGGDGRSWETAYRFLQDALRFVEQYPGRVHEIRLAGGTYHPDRDEATPEGTGDRAAQFVGVAVDRVSGGWAGRQFPNPDVQDSAQYETILSGDLNGDDGPGFTNRSDNSERVVRGTPGEDLRLGFKELADLTVSGAERNAIYSSCARLLRLHLRDNQSPSVGAAVASNAACRIIHCRFTNNHAQRGGAIAASAYTALIAGCHFEGNSAVESGGAISISSSGSSTRRSVGTILDCTFVDNDAPSGSAIFTRHANVANCTFDANTGSAPIAIADVDPDWDYRVVNSIIMSGAWPPFEIIDPGAGVISHCLLSEPWPGEAITVGDPLFVDAANGDYRLQPESPAIDAGHSGRRGAARWVDADGAPRMVDDPAVADRGEALGDLPVIDLGAYERQ